MGIRIQIDFFHFAVHSDGRLFYYYTWKLAVCQSIRRCFPNFFHKSSKIKLTLPEGKVSFNGISILSLGNGNLGLGHYQFVVDTAAIQQLLVRAEFSHPTMIQHQ